MDLKKIAEFSKKAHEGQVDKGGMPYYLHPHNVAMRLTHKGEEYMAAAFLHDVVEDTDYTIEDLQKLGVSKNVLDAIKVLTHGKDEPYMEYIERVKKNEIAAAVKLADLAENMNLSRLKEITEKDLQRLEKYKKAVKILEIK